MDVIKHFTINKHFYNFIKLVEKIGVENVKKQIMNEKLDFDDRENYSKMLNIYCYCKVERTQNNNRDCFFYNKLNNLSNFLVTNFNFCEVKLMNIFYALLIMIATTLLTSFISWILM